MGGLARASEIEATGWLARGNLSTEIVVFSAETRMLLPGTPLMPFIGRPIQGQALHLEAFTKGAYDDDLTLSDHLSFDAHIPVQVGHPLRAAR